jgi:hypothetical protein
MPKNNDDILAQELGKVGARGGGLACQPGGIVGAKLLPTQEFEITILVRASAATVVSALTGVLATEGNVLNSRADPGDTEVTALVYSGFLNMNPAILAVHIEQTGPDATSVRITGQAKEGLIKQQTAEKAARRIVKALLSRLS